MKAKKSKSKENIYLKTVLFLGAFISFIALNNSSAFSLAITLDGNLADWGVKPYANGTPADWIPDSTTASKSVEVGYGRQYSSWDTYHDIQAMYFDSDNTNLYFAVVSSRYNSFIGDWAHEDIGLDFSGKTYTQILTTANGQTNASYRSGYYKYGLDIANVTATTNGTPIVATRNIYQVQTWYGEYWNSSNPLWFPFHVNQGTSVGTFQVVNRWLSSYGIYVMEGSIPKSAFPCLQGQCGATAELYLARVTCVKDWITVRGTVAGNCIPEPATLLLVGIGTLASAFYKARKKK